MGKSYFLIFSVIAGIFAIGFFVQATNPFDITFPVKELGNCQSETACKSYCDKPANVDACLNFAEEHGLVVKEDAVRMRKFHEKGITAGPGGCRTKDECETYCDDINNIEECLAFAEREGILPPEELKEARQVAAALRAGATLPGGCTSKEECEEYCEDPNNVMECVDFAEKAGFMSSKEAAMVRKTGGVGPGDCRGKEACEEYCEQPENFAGCVEFAHDNGMMSDEEYNDAQRVASAIQQGAQIPGGCRSKECAEEYCEDPVNMEECVSFAQAAGFMSSEDAERIRKVGSMSGPGGCRGDFECRTFCDDPSHAEECVEFAVKAGMMDPEEAEQALKMMRLGITSGPGGCRGKDECEGYCEDPANGEACMQFALEHGLMDPEEAEMARKVMAGGPGGCKGQAECEAYCQDPSHGEECIRFTVEIGEMSAEEAEEMLENMRMMREGGGFGPGGPGGPEGPGDFEDFEEFGPGEEFEGQFDEQFQQEFQRQFEEQSREQFEGISPEQLQQFQQQFQQGISPEQLQELQQFPQPGTVPQQPTDFQQFQQESPSSFPSSGGGGVLGIFRLILNFLTGR